VVVDEDEDVQLVSALPDAEAPENADTESSGAVRALIPKDGAENTAGSNLNTAPGSPKGDADVDNDGDNDNDNDIELSTDALVPTMPERSPSPPSALDTSTTDFLSAPVRPDSVGLTPDDESLSHAGAGGLFFDVEGGGTLDTLDGDPLHGGLGHGDIRHGDIGHSLDSLMETDLIVPDTDGFVAAAAAAGFDADEALQGVILTGDVDDLMNTTT
jgi:hypothetical protein